MPHNYRLRLLARAALAAGMACALSPRACCQGTDTVPPLPDTTQEHLVNPYGLSQAARTGWQTDFIGPWRGDFDLSFGVKFWTDRFDLRNLIFGGTMDVLPGLRARVGLRRREGEKRAFQVDTDEAYLEVFDLHRGPDWNGGVSFRVGRVRYLHFPYPDAIAEFDQVPGISDLYGGPITDYRDMLFEAEASNGAGWGFHVSALARAFLGRPQAHAVEAYALYRHDFWGSWHVEGRAGDIAVRHEPLGRTGQPGVTAYLGKQIGEFNIGILYEHKRTEHELAGLMIQFRPNTVTRALGKVDFDYSRNPQGFTVQIPLWHWRLHESRFIPPGYVLVGEVRAARVRTLWQQGFVRNQYEHRLASWGETSDPHLWCVVREQPWYLQAEALVSPHLIPDATWERDRQGPGQYVQIVTYSFYRAKPRSEPGIASRVSSSRSMSSAD